MRYCLVVLINLVLAGLGRPADMEDKGGPFIPDEHTVALYHFDEGEGAEIIDSSGNKHHGAFADAATNKPEWVKEGRFGGGLWFAPDETKTQWKNACVYIPRYMDLPGSFTIEGWFKKKTISNGYRNLMSGPGFEMRFCEEAYLQAGFYVESNKYVYIDGVKPIELNKWHHFAVTYDKDRKKDNFTMYWNGSPVGVKTVTTPKMISGKKGGVYIGYPHNCGLGMILDEIRVSNIARKLAPVIPAEEDPRKSDVFAERDMGKYKFSVSRYGELIEVSKGGESLLREGGVFGYAWIFQRKEFEDISQKEVLISDGAEEKGEVKIEHEGILGCGENKPIAKYKEALLISSTEICGNCAIESLTGTKGACPSGWSITVPLEICAGKGYLGKKINGDELVTVIPEYYNRENYVHTPGLAELKLATTRGAIGFRARGDTMIILEEARYAAEPHLRITFTKKSDTSRHVIKKGNIDRLEFVVSLPNN